MTRAAAFFDLDKTVIAKSSTLAFGRPFFNGGLINRRAVLKTAYAQLVFSLAGADAQQMERLRAQLTAMVTGWDAATVHDIVRETLHEIVDPLVYAEAADLIEEHRAAGREIVIARGATPKFEVRTQRSCTRRPLRKSSARTTVIQWRCRWLPWWREPSWMLKLTKPR